MDNQKPKNSSKRKHLLYRSYLLNRTEGNQLRYKKYNDKLRSILRQEESKYYKTLFNEKQNGIQKMCKNVAPLKEPDKRGTKHKAVDKLVINGQTIYKDKEIANAFNNFFSNVGNELSKEVPDTNHQNHSKIIYRILLSWKN